MRAILNFKNVVPLAPLALASILGSAQPARAILNYYIYESGANVVFEASGSLNLGSPITTISMGCDSGLLPGGKIFTGTVAGSASFCTGPNTATYSIYSSTPSVNNISPVAGSVNIAPASSVSGLSTRLTGAGSFMVQSSYTSGPIVSNAIFNGTTLAGLGFTTTGLISTWTLAGTGDTINLVVGSPPASAPASAPGPLPLFGAAAAFGFSRRLRRRVRLSRSTAQSATSISA